MPPTGRKRQLPGHGGGAEEGQQPQYAALSPQQARAATHPEPVGQHQGEHGLSVYDPGDTEYPQLYHQPDEGIKKVAGVGKSAGLKVQKAMRIA